jgi:hypothetical protein
MPEMLGEQRGPRFVEARVDRRQQRPGQGVRRPRVVVARARDLGEQRVRRAQVDAGAHAVVPTASSAEVMAEPLREPAFDTAGGHHDDLGRERVLQRRGEQVPQRSREQVRARSTMKDDCHRANVSRTSADGSATEGVSLGARLRSGWLHPRRMIAASSSSARAPPTERPCPGFALWRNIVAIPIFRP